jgi:hypothetical protein
MAISLPDIRDAVSMYLSTSVTTTVSELASDIPTALSPGEQAAFDVTVKNAGAPTGVRLINVVYHLTAEPQSVAQLVVPPSPPARSSVNPAGPLLAPGGFVSSMFLFPIDNTLDVGDSDTLSGLKVKAVINLGDATISCHVHGEVDLDDIFPQDNSRNGTRMFTVT